MNKKILETLKSFKPLSVFLYGSQANNNTNSKSDFEIGVIFDDKNYVSRQELQKSISNKNYNVFPFKLSEIKNCTFDTPFQKKIYLYSLITGHAKTIFGDKIIESLTLPKITKYDLLMDTSFNLGYAVAAVRLAKENVDSLAFELFYKSMFFATRNLFFAKFGVLLNEYTNIYKESYKLQLPTEYQELLNIGNKLRNEIVNEVDKKYLFKNISYINMYIIPIIENSNIE